MRFETICRVFAMLIASGGVLWAYPTLTGPTGQAVIPTAQIACPGLTVAADWVNLNMETSGGADSAIPIRALFSLGNSAEIGAMYDPADDTGPFKEIVGANLKVNVGAIFNGDMVLGGQARREEFVDGSQDETVQGYFAWTTDFDACQVDTSNLSITWGINWTQVSPEFGETADAVRGFAGATLRLTKVIQLLAEYQTQNEDIGDADPITALTARFFFAPSIAGQLGFTNAVGLRGSAEQVLFGGLNFTFIFDTQGDYWDCK